YTNKAGGEPNYVSVYTYANGRLTKITTTYSDFDNVQYVNTISYDTNGNVAKEVVSIQGEAIQETTYSYDANGNCISMKVDAFDGMPDYTSFDYDANNNCILETLMNPYGDVCTRNDYELVTDWRAAHPSTVDKLFDDVAPTAWYYTYVQNAYDMNLMEGVDDTHFNPNKTLNRATLVQIMYNEAGRPAVTGKTSFTDVKEDQWYYNAVLWAEQNKVTSGIGDGKFGPTSLVSREQMVTILYNYEKKPKADRTVLKKYPDADQIHDWAMDGMAWAVGEGVIVGDQQKDGSVYLNPRKTATRAQAAVVLSKYFAEKK
ncbi:S-layer homology domain-containing protein, partial [Butyricicoccus sp.]|uniref:S-layer homology domain-containing protein n=1 Tax=Butyricicoccus sp. TaxID=2049021 RepID=UPI003F1564D3